MYFALITHDQLSAAHAHLTFIVVECCSSSYLVPILHVSCALLCTKFVLLCRATACQPPATRASIGPSPPAPPSQPTATSSSTSQVTLLHPHLHYRCTAKLTSLCTWTYQRAAGGGGRLSALVSVGLFATLALILVCMGVFKCCVTFTVSWLVWLCLRVV